MTSSTAMVLVHGAWGGAHTWRSVRPLLWEAGRATVTPSLTGIGERAHLTSPHVDLSVHVSDVVNAIVYEDLRDIVLLGFSYGGMVVTGGLAHVADRVRHLVFLDAFVPDAGQAVVDVSSLGGAAVEPVGDLLGRDWLIQPIDRAFDDPAEAAFHGPRRTAQPVRTFTEPVRLARPLESFPFSRTYIKATGDPRRTDGPDPFWDAADRYRDHPDWRYEELAGNHMVPQNQPAELVEILLTLD